jgi:hypothetical protein
MEIPRAVKRNFVYVGDCVDKIGKIIDKYPAETIGLGSGILGGLAIEGLAHLGPRDYSEFYGVLTPGQPTVIFMAIGLSAGLGFDLTYRGLRWLHETYKNWKVELNQSSVN